MRFDFTTIPDRHNHDAIAIDGLGDGTGFAPAAPKEGFTSIPLWVADMSFATAPSVTRAITIRKRISDAAVYAAVRMEITET